MQRLIGIMLALTIAGCASTDAPTSDSPGYVSDVVYGHKEGTALIYDVLLPDSPNGAGIVYMVSGGWYSVWIPPARRRDQMSYLLDEGFTIFAVHHASAPRYKVTEAVSDVRAALRHIKVNAAAWGVDADRLGVFGGSAGGHLSLMLGLNPEGESHAPRGRGPRSLGPHYLEREADASVAAVVAYFPPVDLTWRVGPSDRFPALDFPAEQAAAVSPIRFVDASDPPVKLIHGDADELVPLRDSELIAAELESAGVAHDLLVIKGGDHGFRNPEHRAMASRAMIDWFREHLTP